MVFNDIFDFESRKVQRNAQEQNPFRDEFFNELQEELKSRVDAKRYKHTQGVIKIGKILADEYHVDKKKVKLAALLHDWDKCYSDDEMRKRIFDVGADSQTTQEIIEKMPNTLHGITAAFGLGIKYANIPTDVLHAVMVHTTGAIHMNGLDMVIYIADALDPNRVYPEYKELRKLIGKDSLHDLFVKVYAQCTIAVINKGQVLHPNSTNVWNHHIQKYNKDHTI